MISDRFYCSQKWPIVRKLGTYFSPNNRYVRIFFEFYFEDIKEDMYTELCVNFLRRGIIFGKIIAILTIDYLCY